MKQLETQFTKDNNTFTQVKRSDSAAIYRRETLEGAFVSFEVFAIKVKNEIEFYPTESLFSGDIKCGWRPTSNERAEIMFDRLTKGEVVIPDVDPETGEMNKLENDPSLEEILAESETPAVETPVVVEDDPTIPEVSLVETPVVEVPEVQSTVDGGAVVTVAKVRKAKVYPTMKIPAGEFLRDDFAELNGFDFKPAHSDSYGPLMREIKEGRVVELRKEKRGPGKPRSIYSAVVVSEPVITA